MPKSNQMPEYKAAEKLSHEVNNLEFNNAVFATCISNMSEASQERLFLAFMSTMETWAEHWRADTAHRVPDLLGETAEHIVASYEAFKFNKSRGWKTA